jgi:hypothetical protein
MHTLNASGQAVACYVSVETVDGMTDEEQAIPALCSAIGFFAGAFLGQQFVPPVSTEPVGKMLSDTLHQWAVLVAPKPLVVLFDEVDVLQGQTLASFLAQLRDGFAVRGIGSFPISVGVASMGRIRLNATNYGDCKGDISPFGLGDGALSLGFFSFDDLACLTDQYSEETGRIFDPLAIRNVWELSRGQPALANALLQQCMMNEGRAAGQSVSADSVQQARVDLVDKGFFLAERIFTRFRDFPGLRRIVILLLFGLEPSSDDIFDPELLDYLGIAPGVHGLSILGVPLVADSLLLELTQGFRYCIPAPEFRWQRSDGTLDMEALFHEFQDFWAQHADIWEEKADYTEAFPLLLLMAFLQRVVNGGGRIEREYAAGRGRVDLAVLYGGHWSIIEIKLVSRQGRERTVQQGLEQVIRYRDTIDRGADAWLVVFDRTVKGRRMSWKKRLSWELLETAGGGVTVVGG